MFNVCLNGLHVNSTIFQFELIIALIIFLITFKLQSLLGIFDNIKCFSNI